MNVHKYLSALYRALWADPTIDSDGMSGSIFIARPNDFIIWCSPAWSVYVDCEEVDDPENVSVINIEFALSEVDGKDYEMHEVPFPLTFDIEADVKRYKELVAEWLPIIYPYI